MNYKKSIIFSALTLGLSFGANAQEPKFSLNGLGRAVINNDKLSGNLVEGVDDARTRSVSGYNLFDLQTNLGIDSSFQAMTILRARSPFGSSFGARTVFEFRQFSMNGKAGKLKYELGDIRIQMTPFTVFNSEVAGTGYESTMFKLRQDIINYENFNLGNTWLLQGAAGQYSWDLGAGQSLGLYAFTTRTTSTNELTVPDRLLSGGRLEYFLNKNIKFGLNEVSLYDLVTGAADYDYKNHVVTADLSYNREISGNKFNMNVEGGFSSYNYVNNLTESDTAYQDMFVDVIVRYGLKDVGVNLGLDVRRVGSKFASPTAQTRRINTAATPGMFSEVDGANRGQILFDRFTSEDIYNNGVTANLMAFIPYYNNINPYGKATPNRFVAGLSASTDPSNNAFDAKLAFDYGTEVVGEGSSDKRGFIVVSGGGLIHLGNLMEIDRLFDVNAGIRFENTSRAGNAEVNLASTLVDFGTSFEILKKVDLLLGAKYFSASGNDYVGVRDGFNLVTTFNNLNVDLNEIITTGGFRIRFSEQQEFSLNYNFVQFNDNKATANNYNVGQVFFNYTGRF